MTVGKRIKIRREELNLTQEQVAEKVGVATQTIFKYENGIVTNIPLDKIKKIARALNVTAPFLMGWKDVSETPPSRGIKIPVIGKVVAGIPIDAVEEILDYEEITPEMASQGEHFALLIKGDSMEPRMRAGDVVIVRKQSDIDSGDIAIVLVNGNEATVKKVKKTTEGITLIPNNPSYDIAFYSNEEILNLPVSIVGKVVELRAKFI